MFSTCSLPSPLLLFSLLFAPPILEEIFSCLEPISHYCGKFLGRNYGFQQVSFLDWKILLYSRLNCSPIRLLALLPFDFIYSVDLTKKGKTESSCYWPYFIIYSSTLWYPLAVFLQRSRKEKCTDKQENYLQRQMDWEKSTNGEEEK